ncbi:hypothetical protein GCM10010329_61430 [Streptomyces spiroverticillatus]|uniref:SH3b domain-containing protein n=1 Tax=Streptomyces finlayi TaxID=67296 RepID=A0A918X688_9ACTN|nr:SH3 domain-containing protein [Streptomyces finlayi]GHA29973.1 hypothetical protein GCM10010329_61430 [Streptomyces spiroverticillatus]GHD15171.1 hypothetical protein GCM10010334_75020 [Streptomyces finlayi]
MEKSRRALVVAAALATAVLTTGPAHAAAPGTITGDGVRIRSCPATSTDCRVLATANRGDAVSIHCLEGHAPGLWFKVKHTRSGKTGYVSGSYLRTTSSSIPFC